METLIKINDFVNGIVWGVPIMLLILGTGVYYTVRFGFMQFRHPAWLVKQTIIKAFKKKDEGPTAQGELTSFQAAMYADFSFYEKEYGRTGSTCMDDFSGFCRYGN